MTQEWVGKWENTLIEEEEGGDNIADLWRGNWEGGITFER